MSDLDNITLYNEAQDVLRRKGVQKDKIVVAIREITDAKTEVSTVRALVRKEIDKKEKISKTAQNDIVAGDERVLKAEEALEEAKGKKEALKYTIDFLDDNYTLKKKMMDSITSDKKYLGG